ncbi:Facilitated trehalose transporter Tret1 [Amphibalanus amphitrite]|uniref:Facilitated trehalose transporter Tret1 n=1 Tax=Amphibalanus amphitrite TaxID=1232801 RepID=A0A6A4VKV6_AMPAM|nr:Facilitated trehalose transporter Tret1 [Amphibalanus amphitrite]KAF0300043.1 Facilitated trehalose transporter Tret1 [Amphibalanus amphitrite]
MAHRRSAAARAAAADSEPLLPPENTGEPPGAPMTDSVGSGAGQHGGTSSLKNQVLASLCACFGGLVAGLTLAYSSPAGPDLEKSSLALDSKQVSLIGSMMPLGALFGGLACGPTMDRFGRRTAMVLINLPAMLGWLLITYANGFGMILTGRILTGFATGCTTVVAPTYVAEVCEARIRGAMGAGFQFQVTLGILLTYIMGKYLHWNFLAMASSFFPAAWLLLVCWLRESPVWLLDQDKEAEALDTLTWLRGPDADVTSELNQMLQQLRESRENQASFRDLAKRENLRPFVLSMMLMLFQQLSGVNAVIFYTVDIFSDSGSSIDSDLATIIVGIVQMLSTFAGVVLVDRLGRKVLLIISDAIMGVCLLALGVFFYIKFDGSGNVENIGWLPLVSLMLFIFAFSVGFGPIPWLMMGELCAPEVKGVASGVAVAFNWTLAFIVTLTFQPLVDGITEAGVFWLFAAVCFAGVAYVTIFCYETKGKTLQEIQEHFRN